MTDTGKRFTTAAGAIGHERLRRAFETGSDHAAECRPSWRSRGLKSVMKPSDARFRLAFVPGREF